MADTYRRKYSLDWPKETPDHQIELTLWKRWREHPFSTGKLLNPVHEHVLRACRMLFTEDQLTIHPWFEDISRFWTNYEFFTVWGAAGSGKSHTIGLLSLLDYIESPNETFSLLASTTKEMLVMRSFASVLQYLQFLKSNRQFEVPFKAVNQPLCVVPEGVDDAGLVGVKGKILGVAVQQGTEQQARQNMQGVHLPYSRITLDELAGMKPAAMATRSNMAQCRDLKVCGLGNPESFFDELGKYSEPLEGWNSLTLDSTEWVTHYGHTLRLDAFKSPGLEHPEKYPFLPTKKTNQRIIDMNRGNEDAPDVWTFLRAFPPAQANDLAMVSELDLKNHNACDGDAAPWKKVIAKVAGFDPSYSSGGDNAVFVVGELGVDTREIVTLRFLELNYLELKVSSTKTIMEQLLAQIDPIIVRHGLEFSNIGVDDSGTQSMADVIEMKYGRKVHRVQFSGSPPELSVSTSQATTAKERYKDAATWLWSALVDYIQFDQVRGLPVIAGQQLCRRRLKRKVRPIQMESKVEMKKRTKQASPDEADACAIMASVVRLVHGVMPGATSWSPAGIKFTAVRGELSESLARQHNNLESSYAGHNALDSRESGW